jgi:hypothetical protein
MTPKASYRPLMICDHGSAGHMSFHADQLAAHTDCWHSSAFPVNARMATRDEHAAAGWGVTDYPVCIYA